MTVMTMQPVLIRMDHGNVSVTMVMMEMAFLATVHFLCWAYIFYYHYYWNSLLKD